MGNLNILKPVSLIRLVKNLALLVALFYGAQSSAQTQPVSVIRQIVNSINTYADNSALEKLYLQTDKSTYNTNDTLWFKGYLFNATGLTISKKSGLLYVEITDDNNNIIKRAMLSVYAGLVWGDIYLKETIYPQGVYTLRAYTNWMRNYDEHYVFKKQFAVTNIESGKGWLINSRLNLSQLDGKPNVKMGLEFKSMEQRAIIASDITLALTEGRKTWFKNKFSTGVDGTLDFNFQLPEKANPNKLSIKLTEVKKDGTGAEYFVPVKLNRKDHTDLQFMPEGGALVAGIKSKVAFKAIGEDGTGVALSGSIYNSKQQEVTTFKSVHLGMGEFDLEPQPGETYTAAIKLDGGATKTYPLPAVKASGITLSVINPINSDSLTVNLTASADIPVTETVYFLTGLSRGVACYGSSLRIDEHHKQIRLSKALFPSGITRFTLLNNHAQPINERIIFIDHHDRLCVNISTNKKTYAKRDSVGMDITVTDNLGAPVQGIFSMAVTDDNQLKVDSVKSGTLVSNLLLTSDLKGEVEDPGYYFNTALTDETNRQLDDLLLTQGWVNYDWTAAFAPPKTPAYPAELSYTIKGKVTNIFNKGVDKSGVLLLSKKPSMLLDTVTNAAGEFFFKNIYPSDTASYVIQAKNKNGKSFNVGIEMQEFVPPVFNEVNKRIIPAYVNLDSSNTKTVNTRMAYKLEQDKLMGMHALKEVIIKDKKIVKESKNLNGPGEADFAMDEADMEKAGKTTLGDILRKNVKGFADRMGRYYTVNGEILILIIDGIPLHKNIPPGTSPKEFYDTSLDYFTAEDVKGIEVMHPGRYGGKYFQEFMHPLDDPFKFCFIEVTTRPGKGPFYKSTPGVYLYKPMPFIIPNQFYEPKYALKTKTVLPDIRSTIYWRPNIITGKDGKAQVSFYTADKPGTYTLLMEGSDMMGNIESIRMKVVVK
ncbi:MAG: hypothetical protein V4592_22410 [Bacteroidota bacterium]